MVKPTRKLTARRQRKGMKENRPQVAIVDLKDHILGRAASIIAKQLLQGKKVTVVRCDEANIVGCENRNKVKYLNYLRKKHQTNPKKGPFHHRSPADYVTRVVRAMLPRRTKRGMSAIRRLVAYEGIPTNIARKGQRLVIPKALRQKRLAAGRKFTVLGEMCQHIGWKYKSIVDKNETERKERAARRFAKMEPTRQLWKRAQKEGLKKVNKKNIAILEKFALL
jgi:large subunit ribosomal protein L13Ae